MARQEGTDVEEDLLALVAVIALLAIVVATRPSAFRIERSAQINILAEVVFAQAIDD